MIEGLRALPWAHDIRAQTAKDERDYPEENQTWHTILRCADCRLSPDQRAAQSCGRMPARLHTGPWRGPPGWPATEVCPGYLIGLPVVEEVARAHAWWTRGQLAQWLHGADPPPVLIDALDILEGARNALEAYRHWTVADSGRTAR